MKFAAQSAMAAMSQFGLGVRSDEPLPSDPRGWLLDQFSAYEPHPKTWAGQPSTAEVIFGYQKHQQKIRESNDTDKPLLDKAFNEEAQARYTSAVEMRVNSALTSASPFIERLVHFWSNHFAVSAEDRIARYTVGAYELEAIRPHVLGRFQDMLLAVEQHPCMLVFLNQSASIGPDSQAARRISLKDPTKRPGLNENLAREILELHTLGVRSGYTQADVTELARALTGWNIRAIKLLDDSTDTGGFQFQALRHEPGTRTILGKTYAPAGEEQARDILIDLAASPATARHVAMKLARHFISDVPPMSVVHRLAAAFIRSQGDLPTVYRALIESPEAWQKGAAKFKTPWEWSISAMRALAWNAPPERIKPAALLRSLGQPVWYPGSPAGYDDVAATWATSDALMRRLEAGRQLAGSAKEINFWELARRIFPDESLSANTARIIVNAESVLDGLALLLVSPEFLRR